MKRCFLVIFGAVLIYNPGLIALAENKNPINMPIEADSKQLSVIPVEMCGDVNSDESVNILDVVFLINYLYKGGPPPYIMEAADVNNDEAINILDVVYLLNFLYKGGPPPMCPYFDL